MAVIRAAAAPTGTRSRARSVPDTMRTCAIREPPAPRSIAKTVPDAGPSGSPPAAGSSVPMPLTSSSMPAPVMADPASTGWSEPSAVRAASRCVTRSGSARPVAHVREHRVVVLGERLGDRGRCRAATVAARVPAPVTSDQRDDAGVSSARDLRDDPVRIGTRRGRSC